MKKGLLIVLLSALLGGLTSYAVVKVMAVNSVEIVQSADGGGAQFRTVNLMQDNWPDFTFAAETAVDAVVYVKVTSTQTIQQAPNSIFEYFLVPTFELSKEILSNGPAVEVLAPQSLRNEIADKIGEMCARYELK